ncbi:MAG TPA: DinB family protein [Actinomycetota bacterium]|nr:DinB family protein [Actinomycetota bacterium]
MAKKKPLTVEQLILMLRDAPARIASMVGSASPEQLQTAPGPDEWSANEVLSHLRACADVWGGCIDRILQEDSPTIRAMNPRRWLLSTDYVEQDFRRSLGAFSAQREGLLAVLSPLSPDNWSRSATVTGAGKPLIRTVYNYAEWLAVHERPHLKQIGRAMTPR